MISQKAKQEITSLAKSFGTVGTSERLFLVVEPLMSHEVRVTDVSFATLGTSVWLRAPVDVQVTSEVTPLDE